MTNPDLPEGIEEARVIGMFDADGEPTDDDDAATMVVAEETANDGAVSHVVFIED
jgi:hypothetical protein